METPKNTSQSNFCQIMMSTTRKVQKWQQEQEERNYFLVDITLTSGDDLHFYVSAKDQHHAYQKADSYAKLAENRSLAEFYKGKGFTLFP